MVETGARERMVEDRGLGIQPAIYREILPGPRGAKYFNEEAENKEEKETWARLKCGNIGRARKGLKDWSYTVNRITILTKYR